MSTRYGFAFIGDSNTELPYLKPAGAAAESTTPYPMTWACRTCRGRPGDNYGISGAITYDFNAGANPFNTGLANPSDPRLSSWRLSPARYFLIATGYNDPARTKYPPPIPVDNDAALARYAVELQALISSVIALGDGATPILIGQAAVPFPVHFTDDDTTAWAPWDAVKASLAASNHIGYVNIATPMAAAIAGGDWDYHIRVDGVTLDNSLDGAHSGDLAAWCTNIHLNPRGTRFIADQILASGLIV